MNWKAKGLCQSALSQLPGAGTLNYWGQRFVTRAYSDFAPIVRDRVEKARWFTGQFARHSRVDLGEAQFYEFGAGWNLAGPLALYCLGVNRQIVIDVRRCARLDLVNRVIDELIRFPGHFPRRPGVPLGSLEELHRRFGIFYLAPADARRTGLARTSIDCITNTYTLEHIPRADVPPLLDECHQVLKPGGLMLSMIDYQDHYSYRDSRISVYNFLKYSARQWRWFNSSLHYQNRMRHCEYQVMFGEADLRVLSEELDRPSERDLKRLDPAHLAVEFKQFSLEDLVVLGSKMVCGRGAADDVEAICSQMHLHGDWARQYDSSSPRRAKTSSSSTNS
jgi:SAM-dependent methyltransferase